MNGIWEHITIPGLGLLLTLIVTIIATAYKFGRHDTIIEELGHEIDEVHTLIEKFHGKCDTHTIAIEKLVSLKTLKEHCRDSQTKCTDSVCRKLAEVKDGQTSMARKIDDFLKENAKKSLRDEALHSALVTQMAAAQKQLEIVSNIQREVVQEVSILKKSKVV